MLTSLLQRWTSGSKKRQDAGLGRPTGRKRVSSPPVSSSLHWSNFRVRVGSHGAGQLGRHQAFLLGLKWCGALCTAQTITLRDSPLEDVTTAVTLVRPDIYICVVVHCLHVPGSCWQGQIMRSGGRSLDWTLQELSGGQLAHTDTHWHIIHQTLLVSSEGMSDISQSHTSHSLPLSLSRSFSLSLSLSLSLNLSIRLRVSRVTCNIYKFLFLLRNRRNWVN